MIPVKYFAPTRLKDLIMQDNKAFSSLTLKNAVIYGAFKNQTEMYYDRSNAYLNLLMYRLLAKYYYSEIGFDIEEQFISRFCQRWAIEAPIYEGQIKVLAKVQTIAIEDEEEHYKFDIDLSDIYKRSLTIGVKGTLQKEKGVTRTDERDLTFGKGVSQTTEYNDVKDHSEGDTTEYTNVTKHVAGDTIRSGSQTVSNSGNDTEKGNVISAYSGKDTDTTDKTTTNTDISFEAEKLNMLDKLNEVLNSFLAKFENLFMGVYTI